MEWKNIFKLGIGALKFNLFNIPAPLNVMILVTNKCNSRCSYCRIPERSSRELTTQEIFILIDQVAELGCQRIGLWGGEPLIRDDIEGIINYAKQKGMFVSLDSNGALVAEKINALRNLDFLILSLDGNEEAHDSNRGRGSFKKVMNAIEAVSGKIPLWTITVLTRNNINDVDYILEKANQHGFWATFQLLHHNDVLGRNKQSLLPSGELCRGVINKLLRNKKEGARIASSAAYLKHILNWPDYNKPFLLNRENGLRCFAGRLYCDVDSDGYVYPCSSMIGKIKALNFLDAGFKKAFESIAQIPCKACIAGCYVEYNHLFSLNIKVIAEWLRSANKSNL